VPDIEFMFRGAPAENASVVPADPASLCRRLRHSPDAAASGQPRRNPAALDRRARALRAIVFNFFSRVKRPAAPARKASSAPRDVAYQKPMAPYRGAETSPGEKVKTDAEIDAWIRNTAITAHHPCGTCAMGIGPDTVTDPQLRVRGVERLRVVDASVMPDLVSAHINACVLMIAEKASDLIRNKATAFQPTTTPDARALWPKAPYRP